MAVRKINIDESEISVIFGLHDDDYICLTDMVKAGDNSERTNIAIQQMTVLENAGQRNMLKA